MTTFPRKGNSRFAHKLFVQVRAVNFGGVKECNAAFHRGTQKRQSFPAYLWVVGRRKSSFPCSRAPEPRLRDCFFQVCPFSLFPILYTKLVMLPGNSPVFIRASRLYDELFAREIEHARQIFPDKGPHQCALNAIHDAVSA